MNIKMMVGVFLMAAFCAVRVSADDTVSPVLTPGDYSASILPSINHDAAVNIENKIAKIPGLSAVDAHTTESTIHFTVNKGAHVDSAKISKALNAVDHGAVMSMPILAHAYSATLGL